MVRSFALTDYPGITELPLTQTAEGLLRRMISLTGTDLQRTPNAFAETVSFAQSCWAFTSIEAFSRPQLPPPSWKGLVRLDSIRKPADFSRTHQW